MLDEVVKAINKLIEAKIEEQSPLGMFVPDISRDKVRDAEFQLTLALSRWKEDIIKKRAEYVEDA